MTQKIDKRQYLRYMKTFVWANHQPMEVLMDINKRGILHDYPVDATTVEIAITMIESGEGLRETKVSMTDVYAIMESMKHRESGKLSQSIPKKQRKTSKYKFIDWILKITYNFKQKVISLFDKIKSSWLKLKKKLQVLLKLP